MSAALPLDDQLCFSLYATSMAISRAYKPMLDELGLTYPQYLVLHALWETDGCTIGAIGERLALESSTITPLVKRLEASGHVMRERDAADERRVNVRLTPQGAAMRDRCGCLAEALFERMGLSVEHLIRLKRDADIVRYALATPPAAPAT